MKERFKLRLVERAVASCAPLASPREIIQAIKRFDHSLAAVAATELGRILPRLVVGQTRLRSDLDLGHSMAIVSERYLGVMLDYISGHIEQDDAVWLTGAARPAAPRIQDSPTSKSARNIERVARRILALLSAPPEASDGPGHAGPRRRRSHDPLRRARRDARRGRRRDPPRLQAPARDLPRRQPARWCR